jgi:pimeloyl-ACP methyl ester carboxylesterase
MLMFVSAVAVLAGVLLGVLLHRKSRQAQVAARLDIRNPNSIVDEGFVRIGGIDQWIGIRGEDKDNPVLLVLHGGPGSSCAIFTPYIRSWEKHFTVVQWDQRGSGKTLRRCGRKGSGELSVQRLIGDGIEIAEHIRKRLGKERILLLANSFGSVLGIQMARRRPDLFFAYIGADQNLGHVRDSGENHREAVERLRRLGLNRAVKALERAGADPTSWTPEEFAAVARWIMKSDPERYTRAMKLLKEAVWYAPGWKFGDLLAFLIGMRFSLERLWPEVSRCSRETDVRDSQCRSFRSLPGTGANPRNIADLRSAADTGYERAGSAD